MAKTYKNVALRGYFNCRKWRDGAKLEEMAILSEGEVIKLTHISTTPIEGVEPHFVREGVGAEPTKYIYKFKLGKHANWYTPIDGVITKVAKPLNVDIDNHLAEVILNFTHLPKVDGKPLAPSGYWVNDICYKLVDANPFAGVNFDNCTFGASLAPTATDTAESSSESAAPAGAPAEATNLPF